ncbi:MAG: hypothetical protein UHY90_01415 [Treponema sp.]|nr:hypothetical protein [Spirochaetia bacterium]MDD7460316.1 hypothetical protein [Spirochaetales bacterium]MDY5812543.1 hypothetical protein [Treponema sp.]MEE1180882.1 hypothetical protein [Treponema sp.]
MEIEYIESSAEEDKENFILPETEKAINSIIEEFTRFFSTSRFVLQIVYIAYLVQRLVFLDYNFIFTLCLLGVCVVQFILFIVEIIRHKKLSKKIIGPFVYARRLVTLCVLVIVVMDIFGKNDAVYRWQAITAVFLCLGWILSLTGIIFSLTVPRYARMILTSFKKDIEPNALASRSFSKVKKAAGNMAKRKAVRSWRNIKSWFSDLID